jgi:molybdenum cofactor biosynthesis enzyme MoaA
MADFFCARPFEHFEVQHNGKAYLCCPGWLPESLGSVAERAPAELWNGEAAQRIRRSILDGSFRYCTGCPFLGARREPVQRVDSVTHPDHVAILREQKAVVARIHSLYLAYDRTCNLSCPSCRKEVIVAKGDELRRLNVFQDALVTPELLRSVDWLNVTGSGDPFASSLFRGLLRSLNTTEYPKLRIALHTNGLLFTAENWEAMRAAQAMVKYVEVSVDAATPATYATNRRGGDWHELLERLAFVASLRESGPLEQFKMSFVVQANNWREMPAFVRLARDLRADTVLFTPLRNWGTFGDYPYFCRAVHLAEHPENAEFLASLDADPELQDARVVMSGFAALGKARPPSPRSDW